MVDIVVVITTVGIALALLVAASDPKMDPFTPIALVCLSGVPVLLAIIALFLRALMVPRGGRGRTVRAGLPVLVLLPVITSASVSMSALKWPLRLRFELSRAALESVAHEVVARRRKLEAAQWIGLYRVERVEMTQTGLVQFHLGDCSWYFACDLVFHPKADCASASSRDGSMLDSHWCLEYREGF